MCMGGGGRHPLKQRETQLAAKARRACPNWPLVENEAAQRWHLHPTSTCHVCTLSPGSSTEGLVELCIFWQSFVTNSKKISHAGGRPRQRASRTTDGHMEQRSPTPHPLNALENQTRNSPCLVRCQKCLVFFFRWPMLLNADLVPIPMPDHQLLFILAGTSKAVCDERQLLLSSAEHAQAFP